jgi:hypothetical protein
VNGALNVLHARIVAALQSAERGDMPSTLTQLRKTLACADEIVRADTAAHNRRQTDAGSSEHLPHGRTVLLQSHPTRRIEDKLALTFERATGIALGGLHSSRGVVDYLTSPELARHPRAGQAVPRYADVRCAQCGQSFGPGNVGFARCYEHEAAKRHHRHVESRVVMGGPC